jgi:hypothetical protein
VPVWPPRLVIASQCLDSSIPNCCASSGRGRPDTLSSLVYPLAFFWPISLKARWIPARYIRSQVYVRTLRPTR